MQDPILITGVARSGTSMTAGIISLCGAVGGNVCGATKANKRGQFENVEMRNTLIKPYLTSMGLDPRGQNPLPEDLSSLLPFPDFGRKMKEIARAQGIAKDVAWYFKGAKLCLIWPVVAATLPGSKWVVVRRSDAGIINSCIYTGFMNAYKTAPGWKKWVDIHRRHISSMEDFLGDTCREVWPERFINGDFSEISGVIDWLGLNWNFEQVSKFIAPELWGESKWHKG